MRNISGAANPNWKGGIATKSAYIRRHAPAHPRADSWGYVDEHVLVAERALGKPLPAGTQVHHRDENRRNNDPGNLVICQDRAYHALIHARRRVFLAGGIPGSDRFCGRCHTVKPLDQFNRNRTTCRPCDKATRDARRACRRERIAA